MHDKWSMAISLVKFAELFDFTRDDWPPLDPRAELFDAGSGSIRGDPLQPTFVWMNDRQPEGSPEIGELWYGPWHGFQPGGVILRAAPGRSSSLGRSIRPRR